MSASGAQATAPAVVGHVPVPLGDGGTEATNARQYVIEATDGRTSLFWGGSNVLDWIPKRYAKPLKQYALTFDEVKEQYHDAISENGSWDFEGFTIRVRKLGTRQILSQAAHDESTDLYPLGLSPSDRKKWDTAIGALETRLGGTLEPDIWNNIALGVGMLDVWLKYGSFRDTTNMRVQRGTPHECHANARIAADENPVLEVIYGLARGGNTWFVHSWCRDKRDGTLVEVTGPFYDKYFASGYPTTNNVRAGG